MKGQRFATIAGDKDHIIGRAETKKAHFESPWRIVKSAGTIVYEDE